MTFVSPQTISRNSGYVYDENFVIYRTFVLGTQRTEDIYTQDNGRCTQEKSIAYLVNF